WRWNIRRLLQTLYKPGMFPRDLIAAELVGSLRGVMRYARAKRSARDIDAAVAVPFHAAPRLPIPDAASGLPGNRGRSVMLVDIARGIGDLPEAADHPRIDVVIVGGERLIGTVSIANRRMPISGTRLRDEIVNALGVELLVDDVHRDAASV